MTLPCAATADPKGRLLVVGATGFIGRFVAEASIESGRPTYIFVRPGSGFSPSKANAVKSLQDKGAIVLQGLINDRELMEKILKENKIETVVSVVGGAAIMDQVALVEAIRAVGTIKRFLPSEFGHDIDRANPVEPGLQMYKEKRVIRRMVEGYKVPYTYICCNSVASWPYCDNTHPSDVLPPLNQFQIYGDGSVKAYFVAGSDIGKFTVKAADDVRTLNTSVHFRPACNMYNMNELAALWEAKIGRTLPRVTISEEDLLDMAAENDIPRSIVASFTHDIFIKGCQTNFLIGGPKDVEVGDLYPDEMFRTLDECFEDFVIMMEKPADAEAVKAAAPNGTVEHITIAAKCS
ncbi:hypothetical protein SAY86_008190 [Trapa natans]|uniref:NmrA-like domain-containing protein n=1 Tax=Trapa natans TaxID=22666 RepID=A0AAN7QAJ5_TRANT|nr:hypothetical protein SAY86_008190 [Trapa natans]